MRIVKRTHQIILARKVLQVIYDLTNLEVSVLHLVHINQTYLQSAVLIRLPIIETLQQP